MEKFKKVNQISGLILIFLGFIDLLMSIYSFTTKNPYFSPTSIGAIIAGLILTINRRKQLYYLRGFINFITPPSLVAILIALLHPPLKFWKILIDLNPWVIWFLCFTYMLILFLFFLLNLYKRHEIEFEHSPKRSFLRNNIPLFLGILFGLGCISIVIFGLHGKSARIGLERAKVELSEYSDHFVSSFKMEKNKTIIGIIAFKEGKFIQKNYEIN